MTTPPASPLPLRQRLLVGGLLCAWGLFIVAALLFAPAAEMIGAARWAARGLAWLLIGLGVVVLTQATRLFVPVGGFALLGAFAGFGIMANGLAFGPGPVECSRVFSGFLVAVAGQAGDLECRVAAGALLAAPYDGVALAVLLLIPGLGLPDGAVPRLLRRTARVSLIVGLLPYLLVALLVMLAASPREGWERIVGGVRSRGSSRASAGPQRVGGESS